MTELHAVLCGDEVLYGDEEGFADDNASLMACIILLLYSYPKTIPLQGERSRLAVGRNHRQVTGWSKHDREVR